MISRSKEVHKLKYINNKWRFFKELFTKTTNCWFAKDIELDEANKVATFRRVFKISGIKMESKILMEAIWEEEDLGNERIKITVYVQEAKSNEETAV
jgi:hypothetical protein